MTMMLFQEEADALDDEQLREVERLTKYFQPDFDRELNKLIIELKNNFEYMMRSLYVLSIKEVDEDKVRKDEFNPYTSFRIIIRQTEEFNKDCDMMHFNINLYQTHKDNYMKYFKDREDRSSFLICE